MAKKIRVGLCGLGFMGRTHLAGYASSPGVEIAGVCHASAKRFQQQTAGNIRQAGTGQALLKSARRYDTLADLLRAEQPDLVDICTPTDTHADLAGEALRAGAHVLCEKPMALTVADCDRMIQAARRAGRFLMIAHCLRWWPEYVYLHGLVRSKRYGKLTALYLFRGSARPGWADWINEERRSGGPLLDLHIHDVDQVLWLLGQPAAVTASLSRDRRVGCASYRYPGAVATVEYNCNLAGGLGFNMTWRAHFERAVVDYDFSRKPPLILWAGGQQTHPALPAANAYAEEVRYFVDCVRRRRAPERVTAADARQAVAVALQEREADRLGRWLEAR